MQYTSHRGDRQMESKEAEKIRDITEEGKGNYRTKRFSDNDCQKGKEKEKDRNLKMKN